MDVDEDSDPFFLKKNTIPLVKNVWVYIGAFYIYVPIKESNTSRQKSNEYRRITNVCQARVLLLFSKSPGHSIKGPDAQ